MELGELKVEVRALRVAVCGWFGEPQSLRWSEREFLVAAHARESYPSDIRKHE